MTKLLMVAMAFLLALGGVASGCGGDGGTSEGASGATNTYKVVLTYKEPATADEKFVADRTDVVTYMNWVRTKENIRLANAFARAFVSHDITAVIDMLDISDTYIPLEDVRTYQMAHPELSQETYVPAEPVFYQEDHLARLMPIAHTGIEGIVLPGDEDGASKSEPTPDTPTTWSRTFGGEDHDWAVSVQRTSDGGYIVACHTQSDGPDTGDIYLIKMDSGGSEEWSKTFGGPVFDSASSVQQTLDGGYIVVGATEISRNTRWDTDFYMVKVGSGGSEEWSKTFGGRYADVAESVQQTSDGGYILVGFKETSKHRRDSYMVKTDSGGNEEWSMTFDGPVFDALEDIAHSVQQTSDGGYIIAGHTTSDSASYLIKTDSKGSEEWTRTFGETAYAVQQTTDGGYIVAGVTLEGEHSKDAHVVKMDSSGNEEWSKTFGGPILDSASSVQQTLDGGYIIAGYTDSFPTGERDIYLVKTDSKGSEEWSRALGGSQSDSASSVQQTLDGGYIIAGSTESYGAGALDIYVIKTDASGNCESTPSGAPSGH